MDNCLIKPAFPFSLFLLWLIVCLSATSASALSRDIQVVADLENISGKAIGNYHALIIGIDKYQDKAIPDLKTAVNDATELSRILISSFGFEDVVVLTDRQADASNITQALRDLALQSKENDSVLIYYAGHGELDPLTGAGYWIPYNAKGGDPATYMDNAIIQRYIKTIPARHVLLIADSCFSGTLFGEARSLPPINNKFYATLYKEKSRWGMTSGNLTPVSDSGSHGHSIFAYHFLKELKESEKSYLTPREIYQRIGPIIRNNSEQMPITKPIKNTGDEGGEFVFIRIASLKAKSSNDSTPEAHKEERAILEAKLKQEEEKRKFAQKELEVLRKKVADIEHGGQTKKRQQKEEARLKAEKEKREQQLQVAKLMPRAESPTKSFSTCPAKMSYISGGVFFAGKLYSLKKMSIKAFCMDQYEVTQADYNRVMGTNPSYIKGKNRPVEKVIWREAKAYCQKVGKHLPTEWEWEKAVKAGTRTKFYWGNEPSATHAWYGGSWEEGHHPVGQKQPNTLGLYDMSGNVWEWTDSNYDGSNKVLRGGSWVDSPNDMRSANRSGNDPTERSSNHGFRCAQ
jgi:formylglycine-generating enzyme